MNDLIKPILASTVRHALTTAAGALVADGLIQSSQTDDFVGAGLFLAGVAWAWWQKYGQAMLLKATNAGATKKS